MNEKQGFDFEGFKAEAIKGIYAGKPLNSLQHPGCFAGRQKRTAGYVFVKGRRREVLAGRSGRSEKPWGAGHAYCLRRWAERFSRGDKLPFSQKRRCRPALSTRSETAYAILPKKTKKLLWLILNLFIRPFPRNRAMKT